MNKNQRGDHELVNLERSAPRVRVVMVEPDFAHNVGMMVRLTSAFGVSLDIVEPCGFPFSMKAIRTGALDYADAAMVARHADWATFRAAQPDARLVLLSTAGATSLWDAELAPGDAIVLGRETAGAPPNVRAAADVTVRIPMSGDSRSLNVVTAAAIALGEAARRHAVQGLG